DTSSRRRRSSTRPASSSSPISTATRSTSSWSAASRARARSSISSRRSSWPMPRASFAIPISPLRVSPTCCARTASRPDMAPRVVTADEFAKLVADGDTLLIGGSGAGHSVPDTLIGAIGKRFKADGAPRNLTTVHPVGLGDRANRGIGHLAQPGLLKRVVCGTLVDSPPVERMAAANEIEAYTLPQGCLSQLTREMAAGRPGLVTHVGLGTFVDPRLGGGRQSLKATDDLVELIKVGGQDYLHFKPFHIDIALIRGTTADEDGNITMEH